LGSRKKEGGEDKTLKGGLKRSLREEREPWSKRQRGNGNQSAVLEKKGKH
jgi:hypothetical protein